MVEDLLNIFRYPVVSSLPDTDLLALADSKMDVVQNKRLGYLKTKGKATGLTELEQYDKFDIVGENDRNKKNGG